MKCPVCEKELASMACACGYDRSRDYGKYPTLGALPAGVESVSALRERRKELVRCGGCGGHTFSLSSRTGALACTGCGRALSEGELKPLTDALGVKKAASEPEKTTSERLAEFGDLLNTLRAQAAKQEAAAQKAPKEDQLTGGGDVCQRNQHGLRNTQSFAHRHHTEGKRHREISKADGQSVHQSLTESVHWYSIFFHRFQIENGEGFRPLLILRSIRPRSAE